MSAEHRQSRARDVESPPPAPDATGQHPESPDTCSICLDKIHERAVAVPCNHLHFDFICLASWVQQTPKCPLCNTTLTSIEYDWRAPDDYKIYEVPKPEAPKPTISRSHNRHTQHASRARGGGRAPSRDPRGRRHPATSYTPATTTTTEDAALSRRRHIYHHHLFSQHIGSNRHSRFTNFTPSTFTRSPALQSRARAFLRRELQVFDFSAQTQEFLLTYTMSILRTVEIRHSSGKAQELLGEFLGVGNARLFWHEVEGWLRSPFGRVGDWDRWVQYAEPVEAGPTKEVVDAHPAESAGSARDSTGCAGRGQEVGDPEELWKHYEPD